VKRGDRASSRNPRTTNRTIGGPAARAAFLAATATALSFPAQGRADTGDIIVVAPGIPADAHANPAVTAADIARHGVPDVLGSLARTVPGLSLSDAQGNPYQPNLVYHGYTISPLQGTAQGLAVYLDGARFNQPFGDTVDFDLLPEAAIDHIDIASGNPVFGLNALGGALLVATRTGRDAPGVDAWLAGGDHGRIEGGGAVGWSRDGESLYIAGQASHDGGWRRYSPSTVYNLYADVGEDGATAGVHLKLIGADSDLTGNGSAPVELLAADPRAVFTLPDNTRNSYGRVSLHPWAALSNTTRLEGSLYFQHLTQRTVNGDAADIGPCDNIAGLLCLAADDGSQSPLIGRDGAQIPNVLNARPDEDYSPYGLLNRSSTSTDAGGALVQLVDRRAFFGGTNLLRLGASYDASRSAFSAATELGQLTAIRSVVGLGPEIAQPDAAIAPVSLTARTSYTGLFVAETLPLARRFSADLDLRYNHAAITLEDQLGTALDGHHDFDRLNPGVALTFAASPALSLRAGYSEANRVPTPAELSCAGPDDPCSLTNFFVGDPPLKQVVSRTWQATAAGTIATAGWSLRWELDLYRAQNSNDIQYVASDVRGRAYFVNIGKTRRQGLDLNLAATRGRWTVRAGYAYTDATFRTALTLNSPDNPSADEAGLIAVEPGDEMPGVPRHRGLLSVDYDAPAFTLGAALQAQSGQVLFGDEANLQPRTGAFAIVDAHASARITGPLWLFGEVTNLFDRTYATYGTFGQTDAVFLVEAPGASDPRSLGPGAPRRWRLGARVKF
jgi:outer membrane receptor protein involved in Fe transport